MKQLREKNATSHIIGKKNVSNQIKCLKSNKIKVPVGSRSEFQNVIQKFCERQQVIGLAKKFYIKEQFRATFPQWPIIDGTPKRYIFYEFDDWISRGKNEISVEIQFGLKQSKGLAESIYEQISGIADFAPGARVVYDGLSYPDWYRVKLIYPDTFDPAIIAQSMIKLIDETRDIVNEWLKSQSMEHY
jgi:hypothetical protein